MPMAMVMYRTLPPAQWRAGTERGDNLNKTEHLLTIVLEECAEIQQNVSKALRFGFDNYHPDKLGISNGTQILEEFNRLKAVIDMLVIGRHIQPISENRSHEIYRKKIEDIEKWEKEKYSRSIGTLN